MDHTADILAAAYNRGQITRITYMVGMLRYVNGASLIDTARIVGIDREQVRTEESRLAHRTFPEIGRLLTARYAAKPRAYALQEV